jgi:hypothetical protein
MRWRDRRDCVGGIDERRIDINREQEAADIALDRLSVKEYEDPFVKK